MSYAIVTIKRAGEKRSWPWEDITLQLWRLFDFAAEHSEWKFLASPIGVGMAGYTPEEMAKVWNGVRQLYHTEKALGLPSNVIAPRDLYEGLDWWKA